MVDLRPVALVFGVAAVLLLGSTAAAGYQERATVTVHEIDLQEDGDATWSLELRYQLSDEEVEEFREFQTRYEEGNVSLFEGLEEELSSLVAEAAESTGREMEARDFEREVSIEETLTGEAGVTAFRFTWMGFAEGNSVGDVFDTGGMVLADNQRLVINHPDSMQVDGASPEPDSWDGSTLVWEGERFFEAGQPSLELSEAIEPSDSGVDISRASIALLALVLLSGFGGGWLVSRSLRDGDRDRTNGEPEPHVSELDPMDDDVDVELLTDRDRIVQLLQDNGGRMKQADIVDETGWSKSKVSMLLSEMEEEDTVSKLRLGRENVIDLEDGTGSAS